MEIKEKINQVNEIFYSTIADSFSQTRQYAWDGWVKLLPILQKYSDLSVLDLGCGNARFAHFLATNLENKINYTGIDSCCELLKLGSSQIKEKQYNNLECKFLEKNIFELGDLSIPDQRLDDKGLSKDNNNFSLITLFGVMHHIYDNADRQKLFNLISQKLSESGYFIFATWEFKNNQRQMKKNLDLKSNKGQEFLKQYNLELKDFSQDDYILDWTRTNQAYRYCRNYSTQEIQNLCKQNSLQIVDSFYADGKEGDVNKYYITKLR